jgi:hypothetical protein
MTLVVVYRLFLNDDPDAPNRTWFKWRRQPTTTAAASKQPELTGD